jgi:hypothetical protein
MSLASPASGACTDSSGTGPPATGPSATGDCLDERERDPREGFLSATLLGARPCPARADYMELCFSTDEGPWNWCFPQPARRRQRSPRPIALTLGPYGVVARAIRLDGSFGAALDASAALPVILAGAEVIVARYLVTAGR